MSRRPRYYPVIGDNGDDDGGGGGGEKGRSTVS